VLPAKNQKKIKRQKDKTKAIPFFVTLSIKEEL